MKLFICGNGFDLHHHYKSSYDDYCEFLKRHNENVYVDVLDFELFTGTNLWSDVENSLNISHEDLFSLSVEENYPNVGGDDFRDSDWSNIEIDIENKTKISTDGFTDVCLVEWVKSFYETNFKPQKDDSLNIDNSDLFINFNYTPTLEDLYSISIDQILYIHGCISNLAALDSESIRNEIQFGSPDINENIVNEIQSSYEDDDFFSACIEPALPHMKSLLKATKKNLEANFSKLIEFIKNKKIEEIVILGHRFDSVDERYYSEVLLKIASIKNTKWTFYVYNQNENEESYKVISFCEKYEIKKFTIKRW